MIFPLSYSKSLLALASAPEDLTPAALWRALPVEERAAALEAALNDRGLPWLREYVAQDLVKQLRGFRLVTLLRWSNEKLAREAARHRLDRPAIVRAAVVAMHLSDRAWLQEALFDDLEIPHEKGRATGELPKPVEPAERVTGAAQRLIDRHPGDPALTYLLASRAFFPETWPALGPWLRDFSARHLNGTRPLSTDQGVTLPAEPTEAPPEPEDEKAEEAVAVSRPEVVAPVRVTSEEAILSGLDEQLTIMIVNSASGVANAATEEQVDAVVNEFVLLNGLRHQSFHHSGFRDALFGREVAAALPAENRNRWRWYFAGFIKGLARRSLPGRIVELYDRFAVVRGLGDTGLGPSAVAGPHVFDALCQARRHAEASGFASIDAVYECPGFAARMLEEGTRLLRQEDPSTAAPIFEVLWQGLADRLANGLEVPPEVWIPVRRRRAHCLRHADDAEGAKVLLEELLDEPDQENRAAVLADLGLLDAGFRRLHELRYPQHPGDIPALSESLDRGRARFVESMELRVGYSAHGEYALGFLALLRTEYARAVPHLERAVAAFGQRPEVYRGGNLLMRARLHLGIALCLAIPDVAQLARACRLLREAMVGGERIPQYLIRDILEVLAMGDGAEAERLAEEIAAANPGAALDAVAGAAAAIRCRPAADALIRRARDQGRSLTERTKDWYLALPMLIAQGPREEAGEALDFAEESAVQGVMREEFLAVLRDEGRFGPVWSPDDARWSHVRVLEAAGDYHSAVGFLHQVFRVALSHVGNGAENSAREVLERLEEYPREFEPAPEELREHFTSRFGPTPQEPSFPEPEQLIRVMVVGGNETQRRFDESLSQGLKATHPHIVLEFLHSGWTSNWGPLVDEFERRLVGTDGVVLSRYMRTGFGEQVRKRLGQVPWRGCGGKGQGAFRNAILAVAAEVQRMRSGSPRCA